MLVSIVITSIAVSSLAFAIAKGVRHTESIRLKNAAYLELKKFTEDWRGIIATGYEPNEGTFPDRCKDVYLDVKILSKSGEDLELGTENSTNAEVCRQITKIEDPDKPYSTYYNLKTYIAWEDNFRGLNLDAKRDTLEFEINQIAIVNTN